MNLSIAVLSLDSVSRVSFQSSGQKILNTFKEFKDYYDVFDFILLNVYGLTTVSNLQETLIGTDLKGRSFHLIDILRQYK